MEKGPFREEIRRLVQDRGEVDFARIWTLLVDAYNVAKGAAWDPGDLDAEQRKARGGRWSPVMFLTA